MTPRVNPEDANYTDEELLTGVNERHRLNRTCAIHAQGTVGILNAVRAGMDSIEHGIFMTQECLEAMLEKGTYLMPTLAAVNNIFSIETLVFRLFSWKKTIRVR